MRDILRTIGGIVLIGVIVVATFLYGNRQRQNQVRKDQEARRQQELTAKTDQKASPPVAANQPANPPPAAKPAQTPLAAAPTQTAQAPVAPPSGQTPETGSGWVLIIPAAFVGGLYHVNRSAKAQVRQALISRI